MKKLLVAYSTYAGSTPEVAQAIGDEITQAGFAVEMIPMSEVSNLRDYDAVVLGGPMIMGWHRTAMRFLKRHREELKDIPFAIFVMCMSLTDTGVASIAGVPITVDQNLPKPPMVEGRLNLRERYANLESYLKPIIKATRPYRPEGIGVFGGRLEYGRLKWWAVLFVMVVVQAPAGDKRNWEAIRSWAASLPSRFRLSEADQVSSATQ